MLTLITGVPMIPFFVYYSMFGFQRIGDLAWAAGDMMVKGFMVGGTAGRTTLNGEICNTKMDTAMFWQAQFLT